MPSPEQLLAAAQTADVVGDALGECANILDRIPGGETKATVTATLRGASNVAKAAPSAAFKALSLLDAAQDAYERTGASKVVAALRKRGVVVNQSPPAHRVAK